VKPRELWADWLATIAIQGEEAHECGVVQSPSDPYLRIFQIEEAQRVGATVADFSDFLLDACRAYSRLAATLDIDGWFYAWVDEMSGTLRCNISRTRSPRELPFACRIETTDRPEVIARAALDSRYASGIPLRELQETDWSPPEEDLSGFVLRVYVQRLIPGTTTRH
jgi:hypothetical protein